MILPDPANHDIPIEVSPHVPSPSHPYFRQLAAIISVFVLTVGLGLAVKLAQQRQNPFSKAGGAVVANILVSQHMITKNWDGVIRYSDSRVDTNGKGVGLSVQPVDSFGSPIFYDMDIQWGMSSTNSVGNLNIHSSNRYAEFVPNGNDGIADIWVRIPNGNGSVIEKGVFAYVKGPYTPKPPQPTPTPSSSPMPTNPPLSSICVNLGGTWEDFDNYSLCQSADKTLLSYFRCNQMGGIYNSCTSNGCLAECKINKLPSTPAPTPTPTPFQSPTPRPTPTPTPLSQCNSSCNTNNECPVNTVCYSGACRNPLCMASSSCICSTPVPTPTPMPWPVIYIKLNYEGMNERPLEVTLLGQPNHPDAAPVKLGSIQGYKAPGLIAISVPPDIVGQQYYLYLDTPSHLRKYLSTTSPTKIVSLPMELDFGQLTPGDIYRDIRNNKDQLVNTFDVSDSYSQWSKASDNINSGRVPADLNGDGVVNNRDLALMLENFGKKSQ